MDVPITSISISTDANRPLDKDHIAGLKKSIELAGVLVPLVVQEASPGVFNLVAGHHRLVAAQDAGLETVPVVVRPGDAADAAIENIVRKDLTPLEEAQAIERMLAKGYTASGAASVLGMSARLLTERVALLALPEDVRAQVGTRIPVSAVGLLTSLAAVSVPLCEAIVKEINEEEDEANAEWRHIVASPGQLANYVPRDSEFVPVSSYSMGAQTLGLDEEWTARTKVLDRYSWGLEPTDKLLDAARAAGILWEYVDADDSWKSAAIITDRAWLIDQAQQEIEAAEKKTGKAAGGAQGTTGAGTGDTPGEKRASAAQTAAQATRAFQRDIREPARAANLALGVELLAKQKFTMNVDVARFLCSAALNSYMGTIGGLVPYVVEELQKVERTTLKSGKEKIRVEYVSGHTWLKKYLDGAKTPEDIIDRTMTVFALAQHALREVEPQSSRATELYLGYGTGMEGSLVKAAKGMLPAAYKKIAGQIKRFDPKKAAEGK